MADQIVSWGGFNSKGTTGLGVTGSFQVSSSANSFFIGGGNVGVGISTPSASLHISGSSSNTLLQVGSPASANAFFVSGSGRVGIGTSNPTATLSVSGSFNVVTPGGASSITLLGDNNHGRIFKILNTDSTNTTFGFGFGSYSDGGSNRYIELFGENTTSNYLQGSWSVGGYMFSPSGFTGGYHTSLNLVQWYSNNVNTGVLISNQNNSYQTMFWRDGNVTIADSSITSGSQSPSRFFVKGLGSTSSTIALAVQNASGTNTFSVKDGIESTSANTGKLQVIAGNWTDYASYTATIWRTGSFASAKDIVIGSDGVLDSYSSRLNFVNYYFNSGQGPQSNFSGYLRTSIQQYRPGGTGQWSGRGTLLLGVYDTDYDTTTLNSFDVVFVGKYATTISGSLTVSSILTLTPQSPLPSGVPTGSFAVSSSVPPKPYFYDGTTWNALY